MIYTNNRESVFAHGAVIRECFPELTDQTIKLAEEAMKGMLVLPGTGRNFILWVIHRNGQKIR